MPFLTAKAPPRVFKGRYEYPEIHKTISKPKEKSYTSAYNFFFDKCQDSVTEIYIKPEPGISRL